MSAPITTSPHEQEDAPSLKGSQASAADSPAGAPALPTARPAYTGRRSWFRSTFTQATILGICSFLAPGLWGAMNATGAGGQSSPGTVNAANAITFVLMIFTSWLTSSVINATSVPWALGLGAVGYAPYAGGLYLSTKSDGDTTWLIIVGAVCCGSSAGLLWSTEGAVILAYPERDRVGRYVSYWLMYRVLGQLVGGAINLGLNATNNGKGTLSTNTYLVFVVLQCLGPFVALLLSPPHKVQRRDRTPVKLNLAGGLRSESLAVLKLLTRPSVYLLLPMIWQTTFSESLVGTYAVGYFTVRSRALGSFLSAICASLANYILGFYLDWQKPSINARSKSAFIVTYALQGGWWIFALVIMNKLHKSPPAEPLDWSDQSSFARHFALYIFLQIGFNMMYEYTYWIVAATNNDSGEITRLASIVRGVESAGQALSYGINSTGWRLDAVAGLNFGFYGVCLLPAWLVIRNVGILEDGTKIHVPLAHVGEDAPDPSTLKGKGESSVADVKE